jgi:hypothetical protein
VGTQQTNTSISLLCPTFSAAHDLCKNLVDEGTISIIIIIIMIIIMSLVVSDDRLRHHLSHAPINNPHEKISIINFIDCISIVNCVCVCVFVCVCSIEVFLQDGLDPWNLYFFFFQVSENKVDPSTRK